MDTIEMKALVSFVAWGTPSFVKAHPQGADGEASGELCLTVEQADREIIDALAKLWLDGLYARRGESSPFALIRSQHKDHGDGQN